MFLNTNALCFWLKINVEKLNFIGENSEFSFKKTGFCIISNFWDTKYPRTYFCEKHKTIVKVSGLSQMNFICRPKNLIIASWICSLWIYLSRVKLYSRIQKLGTFSFWLKGRAGDVLMPERGTEAELPHSLLLLWHGLSVDIQAGGCNLRSSSSGRQDLKVGQFFCCSCLFALVCSMLVQILREDKAVPPSPQVPYNIFLLCPLWSS